jgi:outer membrane protein OmpA-like peptidoglycan-associated protein
LRLLCASLVCAIAPATFAGDDVILLRGKPSREQILEALSAPPVEGDAASAAPNSHPGNRVLRRRGLSLNPAASAEAPAAEAAQQAIRSMERKLDLQILFAFNSDRLTREGMDVLDQLGAALDSEQLDYVKRITLEGHTDSVGSTAYNQELSRRRAESVRHYLATHFGTGGRDMRAVGKGARELADPVNPEDAINRRVRIIVDG